MSTCMYVCTYVYHLPSCCLWGTDEGIRSPATGVTGSCDLTIGCGEPEPRLRASALNHRTISIVSGPSFKCLGCEAYRLLVTLQEWLSEWPSFPTMVTHINHLHLILTKTSKLLKLLYFIAFYIFILCVCTMCLCVCTQMCACTFHGGMCGGLRATYSSSLLSWLFYVTLAVLEPTL